MLSGERWRRLVQQNEPNPNVALFLDPAKPPQSPRNSLHLARGDGTFAEVAHFAGLEGTEWSWTPVFLDVDLDGYDDVLVSNGFERDFMSGDANRRLREREHQAGPRASALEVLTLRQSYSRLATANVAFRNLGGVRFTNASAAWRFNTPAIGQGMCLADLDQDGDQDVLINNFNGPVELLRNDGAAPRVVVRLRGRTPNTQGIGSRIRLLGGAVPAQSQEMICGGRYLSSDEPLRVFAAGSLTNRMTLEVTWRNGSRSVVTNVVANRLYEVNESGAMPATMVPKPSLPEPLFKDVSALLAHTHARAKFDDFARQPLLPYRLSTLGPGVGWFDVDDDGWEDLLLPASMGGGPTVIRNDQRGGFVPWPFQSSNTVAANPQTTLLGWRKPEGGVMLIAGSSLYEDGQTNGSIVQQYDGSGRALNEPLRGTSSSPGPLAMADVDGDGTLELFVGGRCVPGRWPEPGPSLLFRREKDKWIPDTTNSPTLADAGLVSGAIFTDLNADGLPEVVLACEWGPLRVFKNHHGVYSNWNPRVTGSALPPQLSSLGQLTGWWTSVAAGDFDGDGRMDLLAANWGGNTGYESLRARPLRLYHGDFNGDGGIGIIEAGYDAALGNYAPLKHVTTMAHGFPWLLGKYDSFESFSRATVADMLGERLPAARMLEAQWLESVVLLNRGDSFEVRVLPMEAQWSPAFGIAVADFDGDGREDAFLAQNFFGTRSDASRLDAGRGLLLRGDGKGAFLPAAATASGLAIYGEQRGAAVADYDGDGRPDLVVTQHGAATRLFHNQTARPGLRVRLRGPAGNAHGVGAQLRLKFGDSFGPCREIHAGAGYWSQDSAVTVLAMPSQPTALWCRWPDGRTNEVPLPPAREAVFHSGGKLEVLR
jgi:enediyne biosynthesis protein E4